MQVYFIQVDDDGPIKIGKANDVKKRLGGLQVAHHKELHVLHIVDTESESAAMALEKEYQQKFEPFKIRGEWFYPHLDILDFIDKAPLTWRKIIALESELEMLYQLACVAEYEEEDLRYWCPKTHHWYRVFKPQMKLVVGMMRPRGRHDVLRSCEAYDIAYRKICDAMPCADPCPNRAKCDE